MSAPASALEDNPSDSPWPQSFLKRMITELQTQHRIALPLMGMNFAWFVKLVITTAFLGRLGELQLAGGTLGFTFANVTGFSVLNGLCAAMEPICGQAFGAKNYRLLHRTLLMEIFLLLMATLPISMLWLNVDKILIHFGQQKEISMVAKSYLFYLLPDLAITSLLCPLKAYLSSQSITLPIMFSSALGLSLHIPINIFLVKSKGIDGVSMAIWVTDLVVVVLLGLYVLVIAKKWMKERGWFDRATDDWVRLIRLSGPCCLTICLEWWCYEILMLLTGRLEKAKQSLGVLAIVLNFDYLLYSAMLSLSTCASTRVSNELGANRPHRASSAAALALAVSVACGCIGGFAMVLARGAWGTLFTKEKGILRAVKEMMVLMAMIEVVNFPLCVCGGIVRGTAKPLLGTYANVAGFYLVALPMGVVLAFKCGLGLGGLLVGFLVGVVGCLALLLGFMGKINWVEEGGKAEMLACNNKHEIDPKTHENLQTEEKIDSTCKV